jgi:hypothetical protein
VSFDDNTPLDQDYGLEDIEPETLTRMARSCDVFRAEAGDLLDGIDEAQAGHDFWLTRNRHGAGFWDRGLGWVGEELTRKAHTYGERYLEARDGKVFQY